MFKILVFLAPSHSDPGESLLITTLLGIPLGERDDKTPTGKAPELPGTVQPRRPLAGRAPGARRDQAPGTSGGYGGANQPHEWRQPATGNFVCIEY